MRKLTNVVLPPNPATPFAVVDPTFLIVTGTHCLGGHRTANICYILGREGEHQWRDRDLKNTEIKI